MAQENTFTRRASCLERLHVLKNHCVKANVRNTFSMTKPCLHLSKTDALVDENVCITVSGLDKGQEVTLQTYVDEESTSFGSCGHYVADDEGKVNTFMHESHGGTFQGLEPMGLFWSMRSLPGNRPRRILNQDVTRPFDIRISMHPNFIDFNDLPWTDPRPSSTSCHFQQRFMSPGVKVIAVKEDGLVGTLFLPEGEGTFPAVIDVFGITAVIPGHRSALLASNGIASFIIVYVGHPGLAKSPDELDFDFNYFIKAFDWLSRHPRVNPNALGGIGSCIGGAYTSLIAWKRPNMRCFVGINSQMRPAGPTQAVEGEQVEQLAPFHSDNIRDIDGAQSWKHVTLVEDKVPSLPYWRHGIKVLHIQGEDDQSIDPQLLIASHKNIPKEFRDNIEFVSYPGAGHIIEPPYMPLCRMSYNKIYKCMLLWGGKPKQHAHAQMDSWPRIVNFLKKNLEHV